MALELISREPAAPVSSTPLLFVHGAWHGAWCWTERVLDYVAGQGYSAHALSLRGHGASDGRERLRWWRVADYVDDVKKVAAQLPNPPVVIGHSMGGFVVQKYLESERAPAAVLLTSVAPHGIIRAFARFMLRHPLAALKLVVMLSPYQVVATHELARETLFSNDVPEDQTRKYYASVQEESFLAFMDMFLLNLPRPKRVTTPLLVIGAKNDQTIPVPDTEALARAYGTDAVIFNGMCHDIMLHRDWQRVTDHMLGWLKQRGI